VTPGEHEELIDYLLGSLNALAQAGVEDHLAHCPRCARELEQLVWVAGLLARAASTLDNPPLAEPDVPGVAIGGSPCAPVGRAPGTRSASPAVVRAGRWRSAHRGSGRVRMSRCQP
jgi:anti-sigma factor RsiW